MSQTKKARDWTVLARDYESEEDFRRAVVEELAALEHIGYRTGGALIATPLRKPEPVDYDGLVGLPDEHVVIGWHFRQAFAPAVAEVPAAPPAETPGETPSEPEAVSA